MKKLMFLLFISTPLLNLQAQNTAGFKIGYNTATAVKPNSYGDISRINGIQLGVFGKLDLYKRFFIRGNVAYNQKGNQFSDMYYIMDGGRSTTIRLNYLEASVDLGYSIKLPGKHQILAGVGPYLAYGLSGSEKGTMGTIAGPFPVNRDVSFTNSSYYDGTRLPVKPMDAGLNVNVGYQYKKYGLLLNYSIGLVNRANPSGTMGESRNRVFSFMATYSLR